MKQNVLTNQQSKSRATKRAIYTAAIRMLQKYGYESLTVRNICDEAGLSTGTFYHHFTGKDDLLSIYMGEGYVEYAKKLNITLSDDICVALWQIYEIYLSYCLEAGLQFLSTYYSTSNKNLNTKKRTGTPEELEKVPLSRQTLELVVKGQRDGDIFPELTAEEVADDICALVKGTVFEWCLNDGMHDLKQSTKKLMDIYLTSVVTSQYMARHGNDR